jgi:hypothetical protein
MESPAHKIIYYMCVWARVLYGYETWSLILRKEFKILTGKSTGKRCLGRARRRWEDNTNGF